MNGNRKPLSYFVAAVAAAAMLAGPGTSAVHATGFVAPDGPAAVDPTTARSFDLRVLSYNVHGLHRFVTGDSPKKRMLYISGRIRSYYDVAMLQEDFEYPNRTARYLGTRTFDYYRGNGSTVQAGFGQRLAKAILWLPSQLLFHTSIPQGSGLTTIVYENDILESRALVREPYSVCEGYIGGRSDCLASKGFLGVRLSGPGGLEVDLYNTHLDARGDDPNRNVRRKQLEQLAAAVERHSVGRPVIVAGDFNTRTSRPEDAALLAAFASRLGLVDTGARRDASWKSGGDVDYILLRSGEKTSVRIAEETDGRGEDATFRWRAGTRRLSDHPALFARLHVEAAQPELRALDGPTHR
jgi:hypothetical protein